MKTTDSLFKKSTNIFIMKAKSISMSQWTFSADIGYSVRPTCSGQWSALLSAQYNNMLAKIHPNMLHRPPSSVLGRLTILITH